MNFLEHFLDGVRADTSVHNWRAPKDALRLASGGFEVVHFLAPWSISLRGPLPQACWHFVAGA